MKNKIKSGLKIFLLFVALFLINIVVQKILVVMGISGAINERNLVIPPLFATGVLLFFHRRQIDK